MIGRQPQGRAIRDGASVPASELSLPWADPIAQWGIGVFETLAVSGAAVRDLDAHLLRLGAAAKRLAVELPEDSRLREAVAGVASERGDEYSWPKVVVSRSWTWAVFAGPADRSARGRPVSAVILPGRRHRLDATVGLKTVGYAHAMLGLEEAARRGADDGFWLNDRGHLISACTSNVFVARGRALVTPAPADGAREGVTREQVITAAMARGFQVRVGKVRIDTLRHADEVFLTGTLSGIRPVVRIDGRAVSGGAAGPIAAMLAGQLA